ncbi:MAG: hypothetical protein Q7J01_06125 [Syntrophales bacterium]|nr:hypothetical protein [Syntrophales bacterium]
MKKGVMIIVGGVIIIVAGLLMAVLSHLGSIIKTAVNTYGPDVTKTEVRLSDVDISLFSARAELKGFYLGNPGTFKSPKALAVESIYMDVDEKSLISDPIIIEKIEVVAPDITYEKQGGTDNFQTILNNIKEKTEAVKESEGEFRDENGEEDERKRIIIRNVIIRDGKISLDTSTLGGTEITITARLPDIHLTNIGQQRGGVLPEEAAREILEMLHEKIAAADMANTLNEPLKKLEAILDETKKAVKEQSTMATGEEVEQRIKALGDKIKGLLGK